MLKRSLRSVASPCSSAPWSCSSSRSLRLRSPGTTCSRMRRAAPYPDCAGTWPSSLRRSALPRRRTTRLRPLDSWIWSHWWSRLSPPCAWRGARCRTTSGSASPVWRRTRDTDKRCETSMALSPSTRSSSPRWRPRGRRLPSSIGSPPPPRRSRPRPKGGFSSRAWIEQSPALLLPRPRGTCRTGGRDYVSTHALYRAHTPRLACMLHGDWTDSRP
mmetsp:Transcript_84445/g.217493  ORF Transcript_84445/g.217493 Transcript_84445/m.217493 type:complete len:216 (-) Transcript_84445:21-668(-)